MEILKVLVMGIVISIIAVLLKQVKPEYALICVIVGGIVLLIYILNSVTEVFGFFNKVVDKTGIDKGLFVTLLKIIGVGYLIEFTAGVCEDSGNKSIADKVVIAGKVLIFLISMPIITNLLNLILDLI